MSHTGNETSLELELSTDQSLERLAEAAEEWGATWHREGLGGRLDLPIAAGLRHGWLRVGVSAEAIEERSSRLDFEVQEEALALHRPAVAILSIAAFGALVVSLWPFFPWILPIAPIAAVLAVMGWLMVGSRLRHRGLREFLDLVDESDIE
jgi:hypothetical protein